MAADRIPAPAAATVRVSTTSTTASTTSTTAPSTTTSTTVPAPTTTVVDEGTVGAAAVEAPAPADDTEWGGTVEEAVRHWFPDNFDSAWRVSGCESEHDPSAVSAGGGNRGLFQINYVHADAFEAVTGLPYHDGSLDAWANAQYARHLYDEAGGWGPWACRWAA